MQKGLVFLAIILGVSSGVFVVVANLSLLEAINLVGLLVVCALVLTYLDDWLEELLKEEWKAGVVE